jgi:hypothetical protein
VIESDERQAPTPAHVAPGGLAVAEA